MEKVLKIENLKKSFGKKEVLKGINLEVDKGSIIGYIGPNGAGKSTTVKTILGLIREFEGKITILGEDIKNSDDYKKKIGYVPEGADVYESLTGKEYLTFVGQLYGVEEREAGRRGRELMKLLGIEDAYHSRITSYSKGMKQKLVIISSLLHDPEIVFLDEPLNGLDANSVMIIKEIFKSLAKEGKTIFYSSHIMEVVEQISDRIVVINDGTIVADGNFDELKESLKEESLQEMFNQLSGFNEHKEIADKFIKTIRTK